MYVNNFNRNNILTVIIRNRIFRFLHIFIGFMQIYEDEKCGRFIHHRVPKKTFIFYILAYFGH
jgi:hypothetical protein